MKFLFIVFTTLLMLLNIANAQFTSVKDGAWRVPSTWSTDPNATALPDSTSSVVVNHLLSSVGGDVCRDLTINGKVWSGEYLQIFGNLVNKGELRDHPDHGSDYLTVSIYGSITNDGLYITGTTNFEGSGDHHLGTINNNTINFGYANCKNSSSTIVVDNVANISGNLLLHGSKLLLPGGHVTPDTLVLNNGLVDGGVIECNNNVIKGINGTIGWGGAVSFAPQHTFVIDAIFEGDINFNGSSIDSTPGTTTFIGNIINNGTLANAPNNSTVFVEGNITNNGRIESVGTHPDHGIKLEFKNGNLINNGVLKNRIIFYNSHTFTNNSDSIGVQAIGGFDSNTTVSVVGNLVFNTKIIGDYVFNYDAYINMNGGKIILPSSGKLINFGMENTLLEANNSILENAIKSSIRNSTIIDPKILYLKTSNPTIFYGDIEIITNGILTGQAEIYGNIVNNGEVKNSYLQLFGDITNNGSWNSNILMHGNTNQTVTFTELSVFNNTLVLKSEFEGSSYQWKRNGESITDANSIEYYISNVTENDAGVYNCLVDGTNLSRDIIINLGNAPEQEVLLEQHFDSSDELSDWNVIKTNPTNTWVLGNLDGLNFNQIDQTSLNSAICPYDANVEQDEFIVSPAISIGEGEATLEFYVGYNSQWSSNANIKLMLVTNDGNNWDEIWNYNITTTNWEWNKFEVDMTPYSNNSDIKLAWEYTGKDGDFVGLDNVKLTGYKYVTDIVHEVENMIPTKYLLSQNYPNPFNPSTVIEFAIPEKSDVNLIVFNSIGEEVTKLVNQEMIAGYHSVNFDASNLSSGIYFYRISAGSFTKTNKMLLIK